MNSGEVKVGARMLVGCAALAVCAALAAGGCSDSGDRGDQMDPGRDGGTRDAAPLVDANPFAADAAPSGRACFTGLEQSAPTTLASPALDCPSRLCLHVEGAAPDSCTSACVTDDDCIAAPESSCAGDFVCIEVVDTGPFACQSFCVCETLVPQGGLAICAGPNSR